MATITTNVCDKHLNSDEHVPTNIPTVRITVGGGYKEHRVDVEEEICPGCVTDLLEALQPWVDAGRRPGRSAEAPRPVSPPALPAAPTGNGADPTVRRRRNLGLPPEPMPPGTVDDNGKPIGNAGPYTCGAPGFSKCARHTIGFNTKQARSAHERNTHKFNRNNQSGATTPDEGLLVAS